MSRACTIAGIADIDWIRDGLAALDTGQALPHPFDDRNSVWDAFQAETRIELWFEVDGKRHRTPALTSTSALYEASYE